MATEGTANCIDIILAIILPPLGVFLKFGCQVCIVLIKLKKRERERGGSFDLIFDLMLIIHGNLQTTGGVLDLFAADTIWVYTRDYLCCLCYHQVNF